MNISYHKLSVLLAEKSITKAQMRKDLGMSASVLTKINKNEFISLRLLCEICGYLGCGLGDICDTVPERRDETALVKETAV